MGYQQTSIALDHSGLVLAMNRHMCQTCITSSKFKFSRLIWLTLL